MAKRQSVDATQLPTEIIFDILTRVPVKSVGRFRVVSKPWNTTLTGPQFIRAHVNRNKEYPSQCSFILIDYVGDFTPFFVTCRWGNNAHNNLIAVEKHDCYPFDYPNDNFTITSCDGLVAVVSQRGQIFLQNPATRVLNQLPAVPVSNVDAVAHLGFGYDSVTDDYKVVTLTYGDDDEYVDNDNDDDHVRDDGDDDDDDYGDEDDDEGDDDNDNDDDDDDGNDGDGDDNEDIIRHGCYVSVYSVKKKTWKSADDHHFPDYTFEYASGVFMNGYFHWLATRNEGGKRIIVRFNFTEEKFSKMPITYVGNLEDPKLAVLDGCLSVYTSKEGETYICTMKEYGVVRSWTDMTIFVDDDTCVRPLCMSGKEMMMVHETLEDRRTKLVRYDCEEHTFEDVLAEGVPSQFSACGGFIESLLSPFYSSV